MNRLADSVIEVDDVCVYTNWPPYSPVAQSRQTPVASGCGNKTVRLLAAKLLFLRANLCAEEACEALAVRSEDKQPEHTGDKTRSDARLKRQVERQDVIKFRRQERQRQWHEEP